MGEGAMADAEKRWWLLSANADLTNMATDQGWTLSNEATVRLNATARAYGLGLTAYGQMAVVDDGTAHYRANGAGGSPWAIQPVMLPPIAFMPQQMLFPMMAGMASAAPRYVPYQVKAGDLLNANLKLDYEFVLKGVYSSPESQVRIVPSLQWNTYPNQPSNDLKNDQWWAGGELWSTTPVRWIDVGVSSDWNMAMPGYRGAAVIREAYNASNLEFSCWQKINWGDEEYNNYWIAGNEQGLSYVDIGARIAAPMPWSQAWLYGKANYVYWLKEKARDSLSQVNPTAGDLQFSFGIELRH